MGSPHRLASGGIVDRGTSRTFTIDGRSFEGVAGDTVTSAALANGVLQVGDSIYRGRPRGVMTSGVEEPNAFVRINGEYGESMQPATITELVDGSELTWEDGIGTLDQSVDPAEYDHMHVHTDVAVIGAGPAGLAAARAAAATGVRVMLFEQDFALGGSLLGRPNEVVEGIPAGAWIEDVTAQLEQAINCRILKRTSVFGSYDSNYLIALEKRVEAPGTDGVSRQRVWHINAGRVVLATGAFERTLVFAGNDLPGVMLASAAQNYLGRYGVLAGEQVVVFTTNDSAYGVAADLAAAGASVSLVDSRASAGVDDPASVDVHHGSVAVEAIGSDRVVGVRIAPRDGDIQQTQQLPCDLLAVSGGWSANVNLHSQRQGALHWDDDLLGFVPSGAVRDQSLAGSVTGTYWTDGAVAEGIAAGSAQPDPTTAQERRTGSGTTDGLWLIPSPAGDFDTHFVDLQRDETAAGVVRAVRAGMRSVEHVKRYTSISTGLDQGKIGGVLTIGLLSQLLGEHDMASMPAGQPGQDGAEGGATDRSPSPGAIGTTTFRAPFTPVAFAALAGRARGELYDPARVTPAQARHVARGAEFEDVGQWKRPWFYPQSGEDMNAAVARECRAARTNVAYMDGSTLGKIEIRGKDAPTFLNRIYTNAFAKLSVGKQRYGVMCGPDGMVLDDGVSFRLAEDRYLMTTTTGGAAKVLEWLEEWHQTEWPELDVFFTSVTEQWSTTVVAGPRSRDVIHKIAPDLDVSKEGFEFMSFHDTVLASGIPARIARVTFSGELAFEVNVSGWYGEAVWDDITHAGAEFGITPYGTETMHVLRAEKAFPIVGQDTDGTVTPQDLGMDWVVAKKKKDFIGMRSYARAGHVEEGRKQLVSLFPTDPELRLPEGSQLVTTDNTPADPLDGIAPQPIPMIGHVTSSYRSEALDRTFALALVRDGRTRIGEEVMASFEGRFYPVQIAEAVVYDKEGARRDG
ncbi:sarcosine oxidase subunit alpha [Flexivirga endophytica]|uniref:Sarcosine oxidase subunit alpha n=1 Tax=Flexivirga endophytica TaxID=1849103 RepID=A0A916WRD9_9MICO|nr:2Fe-2S iron-sulfur cluster-binding protein [Flexivirga endophytica]GGB25556.1 sarcosine oxidase subunit alpha [Flexivirga endophytica]GHB54137.1 sarcosine oxidase subunit alpha [Flexivirga endophytica]